jgi:hypothetical protein
MINQYIQNVFYHYVLSDATLCSKYKGEYFDSKDMALCFKYAQDYVAKYHQAPSGEQLKEIIHISGVDRDGIDDFIDILYSSANSIKEYTEDWLFDNATAWGSWQQFLQSLASTVSYIKLHQDEVTVENVKEITEHARGTFNTSCIVDFTDAGDTGSDFWDATSHKQIKMKRSSTGYSFIDMCMKGGTFPGCLVCFAGEPKIGKSLWLQNLCAASVNAGEDNVYISLELPEEMIHNRIGANMFSIPALEYEKEADDEVIFKEKISNYRKSHCGPLGKLIVKQFATSTLSVPDLEAYLLKKEQELSTPDKPFKFKNVFVDYINIMRNYRNPNSENTYMKIKQLAEDLKAIAIKHDWAMITATQINRDGFGQSDLTTSNIAESTGLGATVDLLFAIICDDIMRANGEYILKCLYDRVAPETNKAKKFTLNSTYLRILEDLTSPVFDMVDAANKKVQNYGKRVLAEQMQKENCQFAAQPNGGYQAPSIDNDTPTPCRLIDNNDFKSNPQTANYSMDSSVGYRPFIAGLSENISFTPNGGQNSK